MPDPDRQKQLESRLRTHVHILATLIGPRNPHHPSALDAARAYLTRTLTEINLPPTPQQQTPRGALNLSVTLPGSKPHLPRLIIGAHYDTAFNTPGADDNASAVAILLELLRNLAPLKRKRTLEAVFYDREEPPYFATPAMGSHHHAESLRHTDTPLLGMLCLESLGYYPTQPHTPPDHKFLRRLIQLANFALTPAHLVLVSDLRSLKFSIPFSLRFLTSGRTPTLPAALPGTAGVHSLSDHRNYWLHHYPAVMLTNTALFRNPNYHLPSDTEDTLDYPRMARLTRQLTRTIQRTL